MTAPVLIRVFERGRLAYSGEFDGVVELGRQNEPAEPIYAGAAQAQGERGRVAIARLDEHTVSRRHVEVQRVATGRVRVKNLSAVNPLQVAGIELAPNVSADMATPVILALGRRTIQIEEGESAGAPIHGLSDVTMAPGRGLSPSRLPALAFPSTPGIETESLVRWLQTIMDVLQTAANTPEFFRRAARGVVDVVGLEAGWVLLRDGDDWRVEVAEPPQRGDWRPSRRVLARLRQERRTFWQEPDQSDAAAGASLVGVRTVVAAPILDRDGEVIGALYGERLHGGGTLSVPRVARLDAMLIELLATGVAAGLARVEQEKAALAARVQFEQFFTPELARELAIRPDLLSGQDREVTLLFCDIRGFSRVSERLGPAGTMRWIGDTMGTLSDSVLAHRGVLVDYIGDELIAMWGAPQTEPEHARLACRAAIDILAGLPTLNARWEEQLGEPISLGIGINTGVAQVGNTGSVHKFKYGALGNTVNVASRVQGATRYLKSPILVTGTTRSQLDDGFATRRLGKVAVVNIAEPLELHELVPPGRPGWEALKQGYDRALSQFESEDLPEAARTLGNLLADHPDDGPSLLLLSRTVDCLFRGHEGFDPVFRLPGK